MNDSRKMLIREFALFVGTYGLGNVLSYGFLLAAGRYMSKAEFGTLNAAVALLTAAGFFASSLQTALTEAVALGSKLALPGLFWGTQSRWSKRAALAVAGPLALVWLGGGGMGFTPLQWLLVAVTLVSVAPFVVANAFLAGSGHLLALAWLNLGATTARFALGLVLFAAGSSASGGIAAYAVGYVLVPAIALVVLTRTEATTPDLGESVPAARVNWSSTLAYVLTFLPFASDQMLVQVVATEHSGWYAALATVGKLVFYGTTPIILIAYPKLLERAHDARRRDRFTIAVLASIAVCAGGVAGTIWLLPDLLVRLLFPAFYPTIVVEVGRFALASALFATSAMMVHVFIVRRSLGWAILVSGLCWAAQIIAFATRHGTIAELVDNQLAVMSVQAALLIGGFATSILHGSRHASAARGGA